MADSSVAITPGAGANVDTRTAANGDQRQVVVPGGDGDYTGGVTAYGFQRVNQDPTSVFYDNFNTATLDTTDRWATSGTAPSIAVGSANMATGVSTNNAMWSKPSMTVLSSAYLMVNQVVQLETATATGAGRFWGAGVPATTPSSTALVQDGIGWEIDATTGGLQAVYYLAGARTVIATVTRPTDGAPHRYSMVYRQSRVWFYVDGYDVHAATLAYPPLSNLDLPLLFVRNNASAYTGTPTMTIWVTGWGDMSRNHQQLGDGTFPWRKARVDANGALSVNIVESSGIVTPSVATLSAAGASTGAGLANTTGQAIVNVASAGNVTISVNTTAFSGVLGFEASDDNGTTWYAVTATREDGSGADQAINVSGSYSRMWTTAAPGFTHFRVRATPYISGTVTVRLTPGPFLIETSPSLAASGNVIGTTRDYMDSPPANRVAFAASVTAITLTATETLASLVPSRAWAAGTAGTSMTVTAGKTLRLQGWSLTVVGSATAAATAATARLRVAPSTTVATSSPIADQMSVNLAAIASNRGSTSVDFGADGIDIPAGYSFGITVVGIASGTYDVAVHGYEYT